MHHISDNRNDEALTLALKIINKDVKIFSPTVSAIKNEMRQLIKAQETTDMPEIGRVTNL